MLIFQHFVWAFTYVCLFVCSLHVSWLKMKLCMHNLGTWTWNGSIGRGYFFWKQITRVFVQNWLGKRQSRQDMQRKFTCTQSAQRKTTSTRKANALLGRIILRKYIHFSEIEVHALCFYERIYLVLNQLDWLVMIKTCSVVFLVFCCHALSFLLSTRSFLKADLDALSFCTRQETVTGYDKNM